MLGQRLSLAPDYLLKTGALGGGVCVCVCVNKKMEEEENGSSCFPVPPLLKQQQAVSSLNSLITPQGESTLSLDL